MDEKTTRELRVTSIAARSRQWLAGFALLAGARRTRQAGR